jgi:hypothetical protein
MWPPLHVLLAGADKPTGRRGRAMANVWRALAGAKVALAGEVEVRAVTVGLVAMVHVRVRSFLLTRNFGLSIECPMTRVGKHGLLILHLDEAHFDQGPEIVRTDRHKFGSPAFDVTQHPAEMDRRI